MLSKDSPHKCQKFEGSDIPKSRGRIIGMERRMDRMYVAMLLITVKT